MRDRARRSIDWYTHSRVGRGMNAFCGAGEEREKQGALRPQKQLRLIKDGEDGGSGIFISNTYPLHFHHQNDSALRWAAVWAILMFH